MEEAPMKKEMTIIVTLFLAIVTVSDHGGLAASAPLPASQKVWHVYPGGGNPIQTAINSASPGDKIQLHPGTYDEQIVVDTKSLTIQGTGDNTILKPSGAVKPTSVYTYPAGLTYMAGEKVACLVVVKNVAGAGVTIQDLAVDGSRVTTLPDKVEILAGILYGDSSGKIDGVSVNSIKTPGYQVRTYGIDLAAVGAPVSVEVSDCRITDFARNAINANGCGLTVNVHDNTVTGPPSPIGPAQVPNGIVLWADLGGTVTNNTVLRCHYQDAATSYRSVGIMMFDVCRSGVLIEKNEIYDVDDAINPSNDSIIRSNTLHGNGNGVVLEMGAYNNQMVANNVIGNMQGIQINGKLNPNPEGQDPPGHGNYAHFNNIAGNGTGFLSYDDTAIFDAENNWWGSPTGPYDAVSNPGGKGDAVSKYVDYRPWLNNWFISLGDCISTLISQNCSGLTGKNRADCNQAQQSTCHDLFDKK